MAKFAYPTSGKAKRKGGTVSHDSSAFRLSKYHHDHRNTVTCPTNTLS